MTNARIAAPAADAAVRAAEALPPKRNRVLRKLLSNRMALIGGGIVMTFVLLAVLAPLIAPFDPIKTNFLAIRRPPSDLNWLGTDELGRDILSRLLHGARASLAAGVFSVFISVAIGVPVGLIAGWAGGWVDAIISRITDALLVPAVAVVRRGVTQGVFTVREGSSASAHFTETRVGLAEGEAVQILEGLSDTDLVVSEGNTFLEDGESVLPTSAAPAP